MTTLHLLGGFHLTDPTHPDGEDLVFDHARVCELMGYVAMQRKQSVRRQQLSFVLWPDSPEGQARTNLRNLLFKLRKDWPQATTIIEMGRSELGWIEDGPVVVDVHQFEDALAQAEATDDPTEQERLLQLATTHYAGPLLPELYSDWVLLARDRLQNDYAQALRRLITILETQRRYDAAVDVAQKLLQTDPVQESTYRLLMQIHAARGDRAAALHVYHECVTVLENELAVEPSALTQALYAQFLKHGDTFMVDAATPQPVQERQGHRLVGRHQEWQTLNAVWQQAAQGDARLLLISGEAGIGKTRLAEELLYKVRHLGMSTASTRAYAVGGALAYAPVAEWLRQPALWTAVQTLDAIWQVEIARLLPEILQRNPALPQPGPLQEGWQRQRFFQALIQALHHADAPLLLHIDDLQWCDEESLNFLVYLLSSDTTGRLLVVATVRSEEILPDHPLNKLRWTLSQRDQLVEIELGPLDAAESAELAVHIAGKNLTTELQENLYVESEGHPLFLIETIRAGTEGRKLSSTSEPLLADTGTIPPKIRSVIQARLAQLSPKTLEVAQLAAVIGREFTYPVLRAAGGEDEETLVYAVDELWQRKLLREQGATAYDFSHDRIREVAYAGVSSSRRCWLHRRVAAALERVHAANLAPIYGRLAGHYEQAQEIDQACFYLSKASEVAIQQYANAEALDYLSRTLKLLPEDAHELRYACLKRREILYDKLGRRTEQQVDLNALTVWTGEHNDLHPRAEVEVALRWSCYFNRIGVQQAAIDWARRAVDFAKNDEALLAEGHFRWALAAWTQSDFGEAVEQYKQAVTYARIAHLPDIESGSLEQIAASGMFTGMPIPEIRELLKQALAVAEARGQKASMASLHNKFGYLPYSLGAAEQYDQALNSYTKGLALSRETGETSMECTILSNLIMLHTLTGEYALARQAFEENLRLSLATHFEFRTAIGNHFWGFAMMQQGDWEGAEQQICEAIAQLEHLQINHFRIKTSADLGLVHHLAGRHHAALNALEDVSTFAEAQADRRGLAAIWTRLGYCYEAVGRNEEARQAYRKGQAFHCQMEQMSHSMNGVAGEARLALQEGDLPTAQHLVSSILAYLEDHQLESTIESTRVLMTCYNVLFRVNDPRAAAVLRTADSQLQRRNANLSSPAYHATFWRISEHAAVRAAVNT